MCLLYKSKFILYPESIIICSSFNRKLINIKNSFYNYFASGYTSFFGLILIVATLIPSNCVFTQNDSLTNDIDSYFEDGGIKNAKNVFKINVLSLVNGDLPIFYERAISNVFSIELGVGILLPYYIPEPPLLIKQIGTNNPPAAKDVKIGYSLYINPKIYFSHSAPTGFYIGFQWRHRSYKLPLKKLVYNDLIFNLGYVFNPKKRFVIEPNFGLGYRFINDKNITATDFLDHTAFVFSLKFGGLF